MNPGRIETPVRIVVADDHLLVREGVRQLLELEPDFQVIATVASADELLALLRERPADAVVTDIRMPPGSADDGIIAAQEIRRRYPATGVVVLSAFADERYAADLFREGAEGLAYLLKDRVGEREELIRAVRTTLAGGSVIDPVIVDVMLRRGRTASPLDALSPRERDVLEQMAAGRSNAAIGAALFLSTSAVEKHITAIFTKLGLTDEPAVHRRVAAVLALVGRG